MDPGWLVLFTFTLVEMILVILLCMPMPSNEIRRKVTDFVAGLWEQQWVQYTAIGLLLIDAFYFYFVFDALLHPLYDFGILSPVDVGLPCHMRQQMFKNERNAYISGGGLFLFFVLNRLVDIQDKLAKFRSIVKSTNGDENGESEKMKVAAVEPVVATAVPVAAPSAPPASEMSTREVKKIK